MSTTTFELTDFTAPAYLHFNNEKFWQIKLNRTTLFPFTFPSKFLYLEDSNETCVRCGKLNGKDEDTTFQELDLIPSHLKDHCIYFFPRIISHSYPHYR